MTKLLAVCVAIGLCSCAALQPGTVQPLSPAQLVDRACNDDLPVIEVVLSDKDARAKIPRDRLARYDELVPAVHKLCDDPLVRTDPAAAWQQIAPKAKAVAALWLLDQLG